MSLITTKMNQKGKVPHHVTIAETEQLIFSLFSLNMQKSEIKNKKAVL